MSVTEAAGQATPSWWSQCNPSGEADPCAPGTGGSNDTLGFADLLDVINPLQHIPVVGTLYRELTGDTISEAARMAGGAMWGGPAGVIGALANTITEHAAGGDIGATALAYARGEEIGPAAGPATAVAQFAAAGSAAAGSAAADLAAPDQAASAQTAPAQVAASQAASLASAPAQSQAFSGSAASRLDAFIQRASAVRTPSLATARGPAANRLTAEMTTSAAELKATPTRGSRADAPLAIARAPQPEAAPPLKLASGGNTDVANWMMRALDRYETLKTGEKS
jgi:hypothetical protein